MYFPEKSAGGQMFPIGSEIGAKWESTSVQDLAQGGRHVHSPVSTAKAERPALFFALRSMIGAAEAEKSALGVRREKAALSSGCKSHPATAPAGSNRSSHGG